MSIHGMACLDIKPHHGMLAGMARTGRPKAELTLTEWERATLKRWARRATSAQALAQRCRIVLACAEGKDNKEVAAELGVHQVTVGKWRSRFIERRLDGLADEDRPGRPASAGVGVWGQALPVRPCRTSLTNLIPNGSAVPPLSLPAIRAAAQTSQLSATSPQQPSSTVQALAALPAANGARGPIARLTTGSRRPACGSPGPCRRGGALVRPGQVRPGFPASPPP